LDTILSRCQVLSLKEDNSSFEVDDELFDFLDCIVHPNNFFIKYNYYIKEVFFDKNDIKNHLLLVENILLSYLENNDLVSENVLNLLKNKNSKEIVSIISIIEEELPKLDFNVNLKLWIDSLFSRLIGG